MRPLSFAEKDLSGPIWQFSDTMHQSTEGELEITGLVEPDVASVKDQRNRALPKCNPNSAVKQDKTWSKIFGCMLCTKMISALRKLT